LEAGLSRGDLTEAEWRVLKDLLPIEPGNRGRGSFDFTAVLLDAEIRISMDGRGRWMDNVFIKRLWRSLKYECVYLHTFETGSELRAGLGRWITYYSTQRPHSGLAGRTPAETYGRIDASSYRGHAPHMMNRMAA
jgi:putative transposase